MDKKKNGIATTILLMQNNGGFMDSQQVEQMERQIQELKEKLASLVSCPRCGGKVEHANYKINPNQFYCQMCEGTFHHYHEK